MPKKIVLITLLLFFSASIRAQTPPTTPADYFKLAAQQSDLRQDGAKPFHLTATFTSTDEKRKVRTGHYSELWISKDRWKRENSIGDYRETSAYVSGAYYQLVSSPQMDPAAADVLNDLNPTFPDTTNVEEVNKEWSLKYKKVGGVQMAEVSRTSRFKERAGMLLANAYFFAPQDGYLRGEQWNGSVMFFNDLRIALGRAVPYTITYKSSDKVSIAITITDFSAAENPPEDAFVIPGATKFDASTDAVLAITARELHLLIVKNTAPAYPDFARADRQNGDVELQVTIGRDGRVREVKVIQATSPVFANSATEKVRKDTYKPFLLNGVPTSVTATVEIHYRMG